MESSQTPIYHSFVGSFNYSDNKKRKSPCAELNKEYYDKTIKAAFEKFEDNINYILGKVCLLINMTNDLIVTPKFRKYVTRVRSMLIFLKEEFEYMLVISKNYKVDENIIENLKCMQYDLHVYLNDTYYMWYTIDHLFGNKQLHNTDKFMDHVLRMINNLKICIAHIIPEINEIAIPIEELLFYSNTYKKKNRS